MVERSGAFSEMIKLQKEINKLFEHMLRFDRTEARLGPGEWSPNIDVFESRGNLVVKVETPGLSKEDLSIVFKGHKLIVSGEKKEPRQGESVGGYLCLERSFGKFSRSIYIDQAVDLPRASARMGRGVLTITMPKLKDRRGGEVRLAIQEEDQLGRGERD